jgi:tripartite-type tricarboxylate transporter receptor subunit TctC
VDIGKHTVRSGFTAGLRRTAAKFRTAAVVFLLALTQSAWAQAPATTRPLRIIVPFAPGTAVDVIARLVANKLSEPLGRPVVVENRPGAAGAIGSREVARSAFPRDNLLFTVHSTVTVNPYLYSSLGYQNSELEPVAIAGIGSYLLVASPASGISTLTDLIAAARSRPEALRYGSYGVGSGSHLCMEVLKQALGISLLHIPYKSAPLTDVVAGHVDLSMEPVAPALPFAEDGRLNVIGYTTALKPGRTTLKIESVTDRVPGFDCGNWVAFFAPGAAGKDHADVLHRQIQLVLDQPDVRSRLIDFGLERVTMSRGEFREYVAKEMTRWGRVVEAAGVKLE